MSRGSNSGSALQQWYRQPDSGMDRLASGQQVLEDSNFRHRHQWCKPLTWLHLWLDHLGQSRPGRPITTTQYREKTCSNALSFSCVASSCNKPRSPSLLLCCIDSHRVRVSHAYIPRDIYDDGSPQHKFRCCTTCPRVTKWIQGTPSLGTFSLSYYSLFSTHKIEQTVFAVASTVVASNMMCAYRAIARRPLTGWFGFLALLSQSSCSWAMNPRQFKMTGQFRSCFIYRQAIHTMGWFSGRRDSLPTFIP